MLKDNFNKFCLAVIALLLLLSLFFTVRASAEEYDQPTEQTETTTEDTADETHEVIQVQGVQTYDPQLYDRLDKMQESIDALTAALAPSDASEESAEEFYPPKTLHPTIPRNFRAFPRNLKSSRNRQPQKPPSRVYLKNRLRITIRPRGYLLFLVLLLFWYRSYFS